MNPVVECKSIWKIFDAKPDDVAHVIDRRLDKDDALERLGCVVAVADASFSVEKGEIFCIMGLSGCGKSTLVRHINRLIDPTSGQVLINGEDIATLSPPELRALRSKRIGMVFQNMALFPHRIVRDNVSFGLELQDVSQEERLAVAERMLSLVHLDGWGERYPSDLSGGMQQRVGLARALAADPDILLMDEPFSALDPLIRRQLQDQFLELSGLMHKTTIFITHDLDEAVRLGDRITIMKDGRFVQIGTPEEIVLHPADDYVAAFVKDISPMKVVSAKVIMEPVESGAQTDYDGYPRVRPETGLADLVDLALQSDRPTLVVDTNDQPLGIVTQTAILRSINAAR